MKSALVTGASAGIGKEFSLQLAKMGFAVTLVARNEALLKELSHSMGTNHKYIVADLSTNEGQAKIAKHLDENQFDVLINNAGIGTVGRFSEIPLEKQLAMLHLNNEALVKLSYAFLNKAAAGAALINVSSALAFMPTPGMALYSATKSFVTALSDALWYEYKSKNIYVQGLCPGITETNFQVVAGGRKEDLPNGLSQSPQHVAAVSLAEMVKRQKPTVLTGFKNKMFANMSRLLPRKSIVNMTGGMMPQ